MNTICYEKKNHSTAKVRFTRSVNNLEKCITDLTQMTMMLNNILRIWKVPSVEIKNKKEKKYCDIRKRKKGMFSFNLFRSYYIKDIQGKRGVQL